MSDNGYNFGYSFGVPRSEHDPNNDGSQNNNNCSSQNTQNSEEYSIDLSQITPPTFRFGQFGQFGTGDASANGEENNNSNSADNDNDSFLAEPSISIGQFDASFSHPVAGNSFITSSLSTESFDAEEPNSTETSSRKSSNSSMSSVPILVEEPAGQPVYLEEPAAHSVEELLKATIDGDTAGILMESWENVGIEDIKAAEEEFLRSEAVETDMEPKTSKPKVDVSTESKHIGTSASETKKPRAKRTAAVSAKAKSPAKAKVAKVDEASMTGGKRERKTVERLTDSVIQPVKPVSDKTIAIPKGTGVKLGEIEVISQNLNRKLASDKIVTMLHKIIFDRVGDARTRKSNLRSYNGTSLENGFESKLQKFTNAELNEITSLLGLSGGNEKSALSSKISNFLIKPTFEACKSGGETKKKIVAAKALAAAKRAKASAPTKRTSKRTSTASPKRGKTTKIAKILSPEIVDSDVESEVEREVLNELKNERN